jgi:transposase
VLSARQWPLNLWPLLEEYTNDGKYEIDNNLIENAIRPLALGRKNYLFAGSHKAAQRAAMFYSFFGKINDTEPLAWLTDVLDRIPEHKANKLSELLPQNWKPQSSPQ